MKKLLLAAALSASVLVPGAVQAGSFDSQPVDTAAALSALPAPMAGQTTAKPAEQADSQLAAAPKYLADAEVARPEIHGFFESPFKTAYVTTRGLVVENAGLVWQPIVGLVIPLPDLGFYKKVALVGGIWNSVNTNQVDPQVGAWNEMDVFIGTSGSLTNELGLKVSYSAWNFPNSTLNKPKTEHNLEVKLLYNDSAMWKDKLPFDFALNPYVNFFWAIGGSSTVVLGREGNTYYVEPGIVPTMTFKAAPNYPISVTIPTYVQVGPQSYWGRNDSAATRPDGNLGVFSTGVNVSVPLSFIPPKYGNWHASGGVLYYYLINDALLRAGTLLSGNTERSVFNANISIGVEF